MSSEVGRELHLTYDNAGTYLSPKDTNIKIGSNETLYGHTVLYKTGTTDSTVEFKSAANNVLYPNSVAHPIKANIRYYYACGSGYGKSTINTYFGSTNVWSTSINKIVTPAWYETTTTDSAVTNSTKSTALKLIVRNSSNWSATYILDYSSVYTTSSGAYITLYFNQYDFTATKGTGVSSVSVSSSTGFDGDTITYSCTLQSGATFDGWYNSSTKVSSEQTYAYEVNGSDLTLTAKAILPPSVGQELSIIYNNNEIYRSTFDTDLNLTYNGIVKQTIAQGSTIIIPDVNSQQIKWCFPHRLVVGNIELLDGTQPYILKSPIVIAYSGEMPNYLCFTANQVNSTITLNAEGNPTQGQTFEYSTNKTTWSAYTIGNAITLVNVGDKVYFRGNNTTVSEAILDEDRESTTYFYYSMTGRIAASGNIMSLLDKTCQSIIIPAEYCFTKLFIKCSALVNISGLVLPATTLKSGCYIRMFQDCTGLTTAPVLPATTLANFCYTYMFYNCTSLTTAPALPADTLTQACYGSMFQGCAALTTAPALSATTLANYCYSWMFFGCTSLTTVPALPATTLAEDCYDSMFWECTSLYVSDSSNTDYDKQWKLPSSGTFINTYSQSSMFHNCRGARTSDTMAGASGQSYIFYTQNTPI